jgi:hypothetical protein
VSSTIRQQFGKGTWQGEPFLVFVEGYSDLVFYAELLEHIGPFPKCFIQDLVGRSHLPAQALLLLKPDNLAQLKTVAIILDADQSSDNAFNLARRAIQGAVKLDVVRPYEWYEEPETHVQFGIFIVGGKDNVGEIETLAWEAWAANPKNDDLRKCVESFVDCSKNTNPKIGSFDKLRLGAALTVLNEDDPRLGPGARAKQFDFDSGSFTRIRDFFLKVKP